MKPNEVLRAAADTFEARNKIYGDNYKHFGAVMCALFADRPGPRLESPEEWNRMGVFVQIVSKLTRYAEQFDVGGHVDSAHDMCVYAAMLQELTNPEIDNAAEPFPPVIKRRPIIPQPERV